MITSSVNIENKALWPDIILRYKNKEKKALQNEVLIKVILDKWCRNQENDQKTSRMKGKILESEEWQSWTSYDKETHGNDEEEPHKDIKNHPWEYHYKRTTVGSRPGLSDDPE